MVTLDNARSGIRLKVGHVSLPVAQPSKRFCPIGNGLSLELLGVALGLFLEMKKENLFGGGSAVEFPRLFEQGNREEIIRLREQVLCLGSQIVKQLWPTHAAMSAERSEVSITLEVQAMLLYTHVTHAQPMRHFSHCQALTALEQVDDGESLAAAYLGDETLHETERMLSRRSIQIF